MENRLPFYRGCLLGLAIGDALGYPVDGKNWDEIHRDYGPNGLLGYDLQQHDYAEITSYTQLAVFAANGLLVGMTRGKPEQYPRYMAAALREWVACQQYRAIKSRTLCWIARLPSLRRRVCMDTRMLDTQSRDPLGTPEHPTNSFSSPCTLTAAAAVGIFFAPGRMTPSQVGRLGAETVAMAHGDPDAILSGALAAYALAGILQDPQLPLVSQFTQAAEAVQAQFSGLYPQSAAAVAAQIRKAISLVKHTELPAQDALALLECSTAAQCLSGAVYACLIHPGNFDAAVTAAVNHSGHSSAVGALTGAFLGAYLGESALPEFYLESLEDPDTLRTLAEDLQQGRFASRIFDDSWDHKYIQGLPASEL